MSGPDDGWQSSDLNRAKEVNVRCPFLRTVLALLIVPATVACSPSPGRDYLDAALRGMRWVESHAVTLEGGGTLYPNVPGEEGTPLNDIGLYHGQTGRVYGFLQAATATGDHFWYEVAERALMGLDSEVMRYIEAGYRETGLYTGLAGVSTVFLQASEIMEDSGWTRSRALSLADSILRWAQPEDQGHRWNRITDIISGAAGTGLGLIEIFRTTGLVRYLNGAENSALWLIDLGVRDGDSIYWPMGGGVETHYPNFAHGTSGIGFFLGQLAATPAMNTHAVDTARAGALLWLKENGDAGGCVIHHHDGGGEELQYVSWCHGPAGTGRLFIQDYLLLRESDPSRQQAVKPALEGAEFLVRSGLEPGDSPSGYWNNLSICCGTAGILNYMLDLYLVTGEMRYLSHARSCAEIIITRAVREGEGLKWPQAEHRTRPDFIQAQTGFMQGAAGISSSLLRLYLVERGRPELILRLPDEVALP